MHKDTYASGFLYHLPSDQILLRQPINEPLHLWDMMTYEVVGDTTAEKVFSEKIKGELSISLDKRRIHPVHTRPRNNDELIILYAEVSSLKRIPQSQDAMYEWFSRKQINKLNLSASTRQSLTVGFRVIDAKIRENQQNSISQ